MISEERKEAIEYLKKYKEFDKKLYQAAPFTSVSHDALVKCLRHWDTAIQALREETDPCYFCETIYDWVLTCSKCGLIKTYAADGFYGRRYKTFEEVVNDWNKKREESKTRNDLLVIKVKPGINIKADLMDHWRKEILRMKETGLVLLPWYLDAEVVPEDVEIKFEEAQECQTSDQN